MKSVDTTTFGYRSNSVSPTSRPFSSFLIVDGSTSSAWMPNFAASSRCHCSASAGPHSTASPRASPCSSSSAAISPASTVLPMPTSSEISIRTVSCRSAISSGTSWYARGSTASRASDRNGPADARNPIRSAVRSRPALERWPRVGGIGRLEGRGPHVLKRGEHPGDLVVSAAERPQHEEVRRRRLRQHHPVPATGGHQRAHLERRRHSAPSRPPKTLG